RDFGARRPLWSLRQPGQDQRNHSQEHQARGRNPRAGARVDRRTRRQNRRQETRPQGRRKEGACQKGACQESSRQEGGAKEGGGKEGESETRGQGSRKE